MGSRIGTLKVAARRAGLDIETYVSRVEAGEKFCWRCRAMHSRASFGLDASRSDGLSSSCVESRSRAARERYTRRGRTSKKGAFFVETRDGDKLQARARVNHRIAIGLLAAPNDVPCADCGHVWTPGERRHEYDHHLGYAAEHQLTVESVCTTCHRARERDRAAQQSTEVQA